LTAKELRCVALSEIEREREKKCIGGNSKYLKRKSRDTGRKDKNGKNRRRKIEKESCRLRTGEKKKMLKREIFNRKRRRRD